MYNPLMYSLLLDIKDWIENLVIERTRQILFDDKTLDAIADMVLDVQTREILPYLS